MLRAVYLDDIEVLLRILPLSFHDYVIIATPQSLFDKEIGVLYSNQTARSSSRHTIQILGVAERLSRTLRAESTGLRVEAPKMLWEDLVTMAYLIYHIPYVLIRLHIPEEEWRGKDTSLAHLKADVHHVSDEREVEVLRSFNWPLSELITEDDVLPERGYSQTVEAVALLKGRWFEVYRDYLRRRAVK
ncbi:hypothetical protein Tco_0979817 [Tanacetum coccineum]